MINRILIFLSLGIVAGCGGNYPDSNIKTKYSEGMELYRSKCGGCHQLHNRNEFTIGKWDSILVPMQNKAKISDEQKESILHFLTERDSADTLVTN